MKFSVIIPAHNSAGYIGKALRSIACQTYRDYEVIVVCDACTDDTEHVAHAALSASPNVTIERVEYHCDGPTRSRGLDLATGDWVMFMDDDDWWVRPDVLEILAGVIDHTPDIDVVAFSFEWPNYLVSPPRGNNGFFWPAVWTKCWRREFIGNTRFPNVAMESDYHFWKEMAEKRPRIVEIQPVMYHYNFMRKGSQTEVNAR